MSEGNLEARGNAGVSHVADELQTDASANARTYNAQVRYMAHAREAQPHMTVRGSSKKMTGIEREST